MSEVPGARNSVVPSVPTSCVVNSHTEWDPLEEVIVGRVEDAVFPHWTVIHEVTSPAGYWKTCTNLGKPYSSGMVAAANRCLDAFIHLLEAEGVTVRRPERMQFAAPFSTPAWAIPNGLWSANPRDVFLVVGNEIIEAPMADRSRYFEAWPFRSLVKEYFNAGAKWTAAPKPQLLEDLYDPEYRPAQNGERPCFLMTEFEPVFDAADCMRCGRDIFVQKSHVTNAAGISWLERHLGPAYRIHELRSRDLHAIHIDTTFVPLAPGKVLVNPDFLDVTTLPDLLRTWDVLVAPPPVPVAVQQSWPLSKWIAINMLMLDEKRVIVEARQEPLIQALRDWGFQPLPCPFEDHYPFAGGFHCATLDIRRRGKLQSYF